MYIARRTACLALAAFALHLTAASPSPAAEPPDRNDPCSAAGRNTCGTSGVGLYDENRYGVRWFGDYRGVLPGKVPAFCIDSRFWYASPDYAYRRAPGGVLRNRDGEIVPARRQQRIAYAVWAHGQSTKANQQAAVALYVHALMGDALPGEADPAAVSPRVVSLFRRISAAASRYHGPYRLETRVPDAPTVGMTVRATVRLISGAGIAVPNAPLRISADGELGVPSVVRTNRNGVAVVPLTPTGAGRSQLRVESARVASTLPRIYRATAGRAAVNAQRLAVPASQTVSATTSVTARAQPTISTTLSTELARRGTPISNLVRVKGLGSTPATVEVAVFGPFASRSGIRCDDRPYSKATLLAEGDGELRSPAVPLRKAGFYAYRVRLVESAYVYEVATECARGGGTALAAPLILAGGAHAGTKAASADARESRPVRLRIPSVDIDAEVVPVGIDLRRGALAVPSDIRSAGWWKDGRGLGAGSGAVLIAGHVDSAKDGAGVFVALHRARIGDEVRVRTGSGRTSVYRVRAVRSYRKAALPTSLYSDKGPARLVLVTCGGPFDAAKGEYRDNVVVTAVPVG